MEGVDPGLEASVPIVAIVDRRFPCDHSFLEGVMEKRLPKLGIKITWVMRSVDMSLGLRSSIWRYSRVTLLPSLSRLRRGRLMLEYLLLVVVAPVLLWKISAVKPKAIFVRNDPVYLLLGLLAGYISRRPVVFQLSHLKEEDVLARAEAAYGLRAFSLRCKGHVAKALRNSLIGRADQLLVISSTMREILVTQRKSLPLISVFPLGVDVGVESDACDRTAPTLLFDRYVIYVGTMARARKPEVMIDAFKSVRAAHPTVGLVLVGGGGEPLEREWLRRYVRDTGASVFVQFIPDIPRALLPLLIKRAICGLSVMPPEGVNQTISPTKLMEYLQFECPVVASQGIPEQDEVVGASHGGLLVHFDVVAIATAMKSMIEQPLLRETMGRNGRQYIEKHRNYSLFAERLVEVLLKRPSAPMNALND